MEIEGKVIELVSPKTGESSRGSWKKQEIIIETQDSFPKKVCLINWNDKVNTDELKPGTLVKAFVNVESREYNGNWFTDIKIWKLETNQTSSSKQDSLVGGSEEGLPGQTDSSSGNDFSAFDEGDSEPLPF